jgi:hypothetical protein
MQLFGFALSFKKGDTNMVTITVPYTTALFSAITLLVILIIFVICIIVSDGRNNE